MYVIKKVNEKKIKLNFKPPLFKTHMMASTDRQISFDNSKKFEYIRNDKPPIGNFKIPLRLVKSYKVNVKCKKIY